MYRRVHMWLAVALVVMALGAAQVQAETTNTEVQLTEQQKNELAQMHKELMDGYKHVIAKYVEFGVMSEEKAEKFRTHMDERYSRLESNGFIPVWDKCKHKHQHSEE